MRSDPLLESAYLLYCVSITAVHALPFRVAPYQWSDITLVDVAQLA